MENIGGGMAALLKSAVGPIWQQIVSEAAWRDAQPEKSESGPEFKKKSSPKTN